MKKTLLAVLVFLVSAPLFVSAAGQTIGNGNIGLINNTQTHSASIVNGQPLDVYTTFGEPYDNNPSRYDINLYASNPYLNFRAKLPVSATVPVKKNSKEVYEFNTTNNIIDKPSPVYNKHSIPSGMFYGPSSTFANEFYYDLSNARQYGADGELEHAKNQIDAEVVDKKTGKVVAKASLDLDSYHYDSVEGFAPYCYADGSASSPLYISCRVSDSWIDSAPGVTPGSSYSVDIYAQGVSGITKIGTLNSSDFIDKNSQGGVSSTLSVNKSLPFGAYNIIAYLIITGKGIVGYGTNTYAVVNQGPGNYDNFNPSLPLFDFKDSLPTIDMSGYLNNTLLPIEVAPSQTLLTFSRISPQPPAGYPGGQVNIYTNYPYATKDTDYKTEIGEFSVTASSQPYKLQGLSFISWDSDGNSGPGSTDSLTDFIQLQGNDSATGYQLLDETTGLLTRVYQGNVNYCKEGTGDYAATPGACLSTATSSKKPLATLAPNETRKFKLYARVDTSKWSEIGHNNKITSQIAQDARQNGLRDMIELRYVYPGIVYDHGSNPTISGLPFVLSKFILKDAATSTSVILPPTPTTTPVVTAPVTPVTVPTTSTTSSPIIIPVIHPVIVATTTPDDTASQTSSIPAEPSVATHAAAMKSISCSSNVDSVTLSPKAQVTWTAITVPADTGTEGYQYRWTSVGIYHTVMTVASSTNPRLYSTSPQVQMEYSSPGTALMYLSVKQGKKTMSVYCRPSVKVNKATVSLFSGHNAAAAVLNSVRSFWDGLFGGK